MNCLNNMSKHILQVNITNQGTKKIVIYIFCVRCDYKVNRNITTETFENIKNYY